MPWIQLTRQFNLRFNDGREVNFPGPGTYEVDDEIAEHPMMKRLVVQRQVVQASGIKSDGGSISPGGGVASSPVGGMGPQAGAVMAGVTAGDLGTITSIVPGHAAEAGGNSADNIMSPAVIENRTAEVRTRIDATNQAPGQASTMRTGPGEEDESDADKQRAANARQRLDSDDENKTGGVTQQNTGRPRSNTNDQGGDGLEAGSEEGEESGEDEAEDKSGEKKIDKAKPEQDKSEASRRGRR